MVSSADVSLDPGLVHREVWRWVRFVGSSGDFREPVLGNQFRQTFQSSV
jgi:hypothetical protein